MSAIPPVLLVGGGPGDPRLITIAGAEALRHAEVVLHDRLAAPELLQLAPDAELIDVGKSPDGGSVSQDEIHTLMIDHARRGRRVVRLKGGDPFVFGRGGEEAAALSAADIPVQVIPGVSSAHAAAAAAGIAVTDRRAASAFTVVTGTAGDGDAPPIDWAAAARVGGTIVVMMGWRNLEEIVRRLVAAGLPPDVPAAAIERAARPQQRVVTAPLVELQRRAASMRPPVTVVIGPTVQLATSLTAGPLSGWRIVVTRPADQAAALVGRLRALGAEVVELPTIEIRPRDDDAVNRAVRRLADGRYDLVALTSVNGVRLLWQALRRHGCDARAFAGAKIAAIGRETARALAGVGLAADLTPEEYSTAALAELIQRADVSGWRILLPRAAQGSPLLRQRLLDAGAAVDDVPFYDTITPLPNPAALAELRRGVDLVTLTSPSTADGLIHITRDSESGVAHLDSLQAVCIGPVSAAAARHLGLRVAATADVFTIDGLIEAVVQYCSAHHASRT